MKLKPELSLWLSKIIAILFTCTFNTQCEGIRNKANIKSRNNKVLKTNEKKRKLHGTEVNSIYSPNGDLTI